MQEPDTRWTDHGGVLCAHREPPATIEPPVLHATEHADTGLTYLSLAGRAGWLTLETSRHGTERTVRDTEGYIVATFGDPWFILDLPSSLLHWWRDDMGAWLACTTMYAACRDIAARYLPVIGS